MLDPKLLRNQIDETAQRLASRAYTLPKDLLLSLEAERKRLQAEVQTLQNQRNEHAKAIGRAKAQGQALDALFADAAQFGDKLQDVEAQFYAVQLAIEEIVSHIPNLPHASVPEGRTEQDNVELRRWGAIPDAGPYRDHTELAALAQLMDFEAASRMSGARFTVLRAGLAQLHRALGQFMLDLHTQNHGYTEIYGPYLVSSQSLFGTGQLPKFKDDQFNIADHDLALIPTAEVMLTNLVRDQIVEGAQLPLKWVTLSPCFRSEAGAYGKDTRGMFRQHQFDKVELVQVVHPEHSYQALEELVHHAERVLQLLELPYRVMALCAGDMGFSASKTYDLEVWLPGQGRYREISSCSNTESFQARRLQARMRSSKGQKTEYLHTLNGSGLAVGRTLIAIMENYQTPDNRIAIPSVLKRYMGDQSYINLS